MKSSTTLLFGLVAAALATSEPQITARAQLEVRQEDPALLGWVSESGASQFSDLRTCDYPATVSSSAALAQCCTGSSCVFWSSCSAGTLYAQATSLRCDVGYCNTAVLVPTPGAQSGVSYLGCWGTELGQGPFTVVKDVSNATKTKAVVSTTSASQSSVRSSAASSAAGSSGSAARSETGTAATQASSSPTPSTGAAGGNAAKPLTGVFGLAAMLLGML
ncbi:hypothetical protein C7974DRAFT_190723 [Boeremia exigua]|uniref:uncharacterized protein n=1 Tax=Boeremia exigua TaxID=749465 RepID=UPI001E8D60EA|nr:uncharacterized protein C7974DRAFT_190723 [Boeremia exigua]KAH6629662.1 hypothetical protein C7974DRAFT_190723 [Boeremia exigua]